MRIFIKMKCIAYDDEWYIVWINLSGLAYFDMEYFELSVVVFTLIAVVFRVHLFLQVRKLLV